MSEREVWRRYDDAEQRLSAHVSERMLDLGGVGPGSRVLDLASGRGEPAVRAAGRVAPGGRVLATDRSPDMLALARERAAREGVDHLALQVADAQTLEGVPDGAFDVALCRWGLMYLDDPRQALAAVARRLVPGGRLVVASWGPPADAPWSSMPRDVLARQVPVATPDPGVPGAFRHADPAVLRADLASAGFRVEHEEDMTTAVMESETPTGLVDWCLAFGLRRLLDAHPPAVRAAWERDMLAEAGRYRDTDGWYRLGGVTRLVVAGLDRGQVLHRCKT